MLVQDNLNNTMNAAAIKRNSGKWTMGGVLRVSEKAEHEWCTARRAADEDEDGFSYKTKQVKDTDVTQKLNNVVLTSHFDSGKVSPGFSSPAGLADVGDCGSDEDMDIGNGIGWFWPSGVSGPRLDLGWIMITVLPVGLEHENKNPAVWECVKSTSDVTERVGRL